MVVSVHRAGIDGLAGEWAELHAADPVATPFTSLGWARAWLAEWDPGAEPAIVCVRDGDGALIGLAPLVQTRRGPLRILEPLGIEPGDYWDVIARPERRADVLEALAAALAARFTPWDAAYLRYLPPGTGTEEALRAAGLVIGVRRDVPAPAIELPDSFDAYLKLLPSNRRQNLKRHLRRLDEGEVELTEVAGDAELDAALDRWQQLRRMQWDSAGKDINPEHLSPRFLALMRALAGDALVWEFRHEGRVVGVYVNFADARTFHWYLGGFDPEVTSLGLGKIAIGHSIRTSIDAGRSRYDFGRGAEPYKYWYGAENRPLPAFVAGHRGPRSRLALAGVKALLARREAATPPDET